MVLAIPMAATSRAMAPTPPKIDLQDQVEIIDALQEGLRRV